MTECITTTESFIIDDIPEFEEECPRDILINWVN
jgi:hypothetical protein